MINSKKQIMQQMQTIQQKQTMQQKQSKQTTLTTQTMQTMQTILTTPTTQTIQTIQTKRLAWGTAFTTMLALTIVLAFALLLAGCGGDSRPMTGYGGEPMTTAAASMYTANSSEFDGNYYDGGGGYVAEIQMQVQAPQDYSGLAQTAVDGNTSVELKEKEEERKIIQNATIDVEAENAELFYGALAAYCRSLGGYEFSNSISNFDEYSVIFAVFKVPPENLEQVISFVGSSAKLINSNMSSEDITESFYDAETRLETKRRSLDSYYNMLRGARTVEEIVLIQQTVDRITEDIEALEGRLRMWSSQVSMATLTINVRQYNDPLKIRKEITWNTLSVSDMGYLISRGFMTVLNTGVSMLQWLIIGIAFLSPILALAAVIILLGRWSRKKRGLPLKKITLPWNRANNFHASVYEAQNLPGGKVQGGNQLLQEKPPQWWDQTQSEGQTRPGDQTQPGVQTQPGGHTQPEGQTQPEGDKPK